MDHELVIGAAAGRSYVAEIDIPARQYETDQEGNQTALPLDMDSVTLTLWATI
jgi:hypothetical protein